jgi:hypothetical protein
MARKEVSRNRPKQAKSPETGARRLYVSRPIVHLRRAVDELAWQVARLVELERGTMAVALHLAEALVPRVAGKRKA